MKKSSILPVPKKPFALYARVSSDEQREAETIKTQVETITQYAKASGIVLGQHYLDDGISGIVPFHERPAGARLLEDARAGKCGGLICLNHKRLGREAFVIHLAAKQVERELGLEIIAIREPVPSEATPGARAMMRAVYAGAAESDRVDILANSLEGMERAAREGRWNGGRPPFGFCVDEGTGGLVIHEEQAAVVREIFSRYRAGESARAIAESLTARGVLHPMCWLKPGFRKPSPSKPWHKGTVSLILCNPIYTGQSSWRRRTGKGYSPHRPRHSRGGGEGIPIPLPRVVSEEQFLDAMRVAENNGRFASRNVRRFYLVRNLIRCGRCGRNYGSIYTGKPGNMHPYYRCGTHLCYGYGDKKCGNSGVRADYIDAAIWTHCADFVKNPGPVLDELRTRLRQRRGEQPRGASEQERINAALSQNRVAQEKVLKLTMSEALSYEVGERELRKLKREAADLESARVGLLKRRDIEQERENRLLSAEALLERLSAAVDTANDALKREIVLALVEEVIVELDDEKLRTGIKRPTIRVRFSFVPQRTVGSADSGTPNSTTRVMLVVSGGASVKRTNSPAVEAP
jgi:site-specific DNA recombinase